MTEIVRKIVHVDMDAFYAAVEQRDRPELRGRPVVVGGPPDSRAVVCTASYEARVFGVRSAMPCSQAHRLCPQAVFVAPRFSAYSEASRKLHSILHDYTDAIEPLSLDEAFLDVTENRIGSPLAVPIAKEIRRRVRDEMALTVSAGVSYCKFLAKIASDLRKPDGLSVILPEQARDFIDHLAVSKFFSVGPATQKRLESIGIRTGLEMRLAGPARLEKLLGRQGLFLHGLSTGVDHRPVVAGRSRKSVGAEDTFQTDTTDILWMRRFLSVLAAKVADRLGGNGGRTVTFKVKYHDFRQVTRSRTLATPVSDGETLLRLAEELMAETQAGSVPVRLLGLQVSQFESPDQGPIPWEQLELPLPDPG
jgi:DNA polymerase IV